MDEMFRQVYEYTCIELEEKGYSKNWNLNMPES
jgi:NTE family protein